jgi:hypothetical protein
MILKSLGNIAKFENLAFEDIRYDSLLEERLGDDVRRCSGRPCLSPACVRFSVSDPLPANLAEGLANLTIARVRGENENLLPIPDGDFGENWDELPSACTCETVERVVGFSEQLEVHQRWKYDCPLARSGQANSFDRRNPFCINGLPSIARRDLIWRSAHNVKPRVEPLGHERRSNPAGKNGETIEAKFDVKISDDIEELTFACVDSPSYIRITSFLERPSIGISGQKYPGFLEGFPDRSNPQRALHGV